VPFLKITARQNNNARKYLHGDLYNYVSLTFDPNNLAPGSHV